MSIFYTGAPIVKNKEQRKVSRLAIKVHSARRKVQQPGLVVVVVANPDKVKA